MKRGTLETRSSRIRVPMEPDGPRDGANMPTFRLHVLDNALIVEVPETCSNLEEPDYLALEREIQSLLPRLPAPPVVIFDLRRTDFFGTILLETILRARKTCENLGGDIATVGIHPPVDEILRIAHLDALIPQFQSLHEALESLPRNAPEGHSEETPCG